VHHPDEPDARDDYPDSTALMVTKAASGKIGERFLSGDEMATWQDYGQEYAKLFKQAISGGFTKTASVAEKASANYSGSQVLKKIAEDTKTRWGRPLTDAEREQLSDAIAEALGVPRETLRKAVKSASNDSHTDLIIHTVDIIDKILGK
jgi:hypothetical protein